MTIVAYNDNHIINVLSEMLLTVQMSEIIAFLQTIIIVNE